MVFYMLQTTEKNEKNVGLTAYASKLVSQRNVIETL